MCIVEAHPREYYKDLAEKPQYYRDNPIPEPVNLYVSPIDPQGWITRWVEDGDEEIQVAEYVREPWIEYYILVYKRDDEKYMPPLEMQKANRGSDWVAPHNSWRDATKEEMKSILGCLDKGEYEIVYTKQERYPALTQKGGKVKSPPIMVSQIFKISKLNLIIKKLRAHRIRIDIEER